MMIRKTKRQRKNRGCAAPGAPLANIRQPTTLPTMNRESEAALLEFCAQQRGDFFPAAWLAYDALPHDELAATALFLAGVEWFGHRRELHDVAGQLAPDARFADLARRTAFDCSRFSNLLRRHHAFAAS